MMWQPGIDEPRSFELLSPVSLEEASELAAKHGTDAAFLAGGCDLIDQLKHQWNNPRYVINLKTVQGLKAVERTGNTIRLGALTTLGEIERNAELKKTMPGLAMAAGRVATPQIRNLGTIGGNLLQDSRCPYYRGPWYCYRAGGITCDAHHGINIEHAIFGGARCYTVTPSDTAPMLVALDAVAHIHGPNGRRELPLRDLFVPPSENILVMHRLAPDEILYRLEIPVSETHRSIFIKYAPRNAWDFAQASVAITLNQSGGAGGVVRDCRIVLGAVAPTPWRSDGSEQVIKGQSLNQTIIEAAATAAIEGAKPLQYNEYKIGLVKKLVRAGLTELSK